MVQEKYFRQLDLYNNVSLIDRNDITIIIPVLNEEKAIGKVLHSVKIEGFRKILVVDGFSTDNTVLIASKNGVKVILQEGKGKTGAIQTAFNHIETQYLVIMDGDCTYDPRDIFNFFPPLEKNELVIGARTYGRQNIPILNRFGNWLINFVFNLLFGTNVIDVCSGMYAMSTDYARTLIFDTSGFDVEVEIAAQAATDGTIMEVPITYNERVGQQKLRPFIHGPQILRTVLKLARTYNPVLFYSLIAGIIFFPAVFLLIFVGIEWFNGVWHNGLALLGIVLLLFSGQALTVSITSTLLRKFEQRMKKRLT